MFMAIAWFAVPVATGIVGHTEDFEEYMVDV